MSRDKQNQEVEIDCTHDQVDDPVDYQPIQKYLQESNARMNGIDSSFFNMHASFLTCPALAKAGGIVAVLNFLQACTYLEEAIDICGDVADIDQTCIDHFLLKLHTDGRLSVYRIHELVSLIQRFLKHSEQEGCKVQPLVFSVQENIHN